MNTDSRWIYDADKHEAVEQPTMDKPYRDWFASIYHDELAIEREFSKYCDEYEKHIASLRHIPVSGEVTWKHGDDVTGKFEIEVEEFTRVAIPIQKQPQVIRGQFHKRENETVDEAYNRFKSQEQPHLPMGVKGEVPTESMKKDMDDYWKAMDKYQEQPHTESEDELWDEAVKAILKHYPEGKAELKKQFTIKRK